MASDGLMLRAHKFACEPFRAVGTCTSPMQKAGLRAAEMGEETAP